MAGADIVLRRWLRGRAGFDWRVLLLSRGMLMSFADERAWAQLGFGYCRFSSKIVYAGDC